ncbi:MAG: hypothetical protein R3F41_10550 [Gammaproteobacteria bacterium]|nr:hypothetical protein [Pseudomonadales bacterium]
MGIINTAEALLELGLPSLLFSWLIFHWLFAEGEIDRDIRHRALKAELKNNRKSLKKAIRTTGNRNVRLVYKRWASFGGGFYGIAGLWTFLVIEISDLVNFLRSGNYLAPFSGDILDIVISFLMNQITNSIQALLWFSYWPGPGDSMLIWIAAGYLGYWVGIELARRLLTPITLFRPDRKH